MNDREIVSLFFSRDENAIKETEKKYGDYCRAVAVRILNSVLDAEECVNDAYFAVWNRIPPEKPKDLGAFVSRITRNIAVDRVRADTAGKRGGSGEDLPIDELDGCCESAESVYVAKELAAAVNKFLKRLPKRERDIFMNRYYFCRKTSDIADSYGFDEDYIRTVLARTRQNSKRILQRRNSYERQRSYARRRRSRRQIYKIG